MDHDSTAEEDYIRASVVLKCAEIRWGQTRALEAYGLVQDERAIPPHPCAFTCKTCDDYYSAMVRCGIRPNWLTSNCPWKGAFSVTRLTFGNIGLWPKMYKNPLYVFDPYEFRNKGLALPRVIDNWDGYGKSFPMPLLRMERIGMTLLYNGFVPDGARLDDPFALTLTFEERVLEEPPHAPLHEEGLWKCATCHQRGTTIEMLTPSPLREPPGGDMSLTATQAAIAAECDALKELLLEKNRAYGNSALEPVRIFSKAPKREQILVRIDDKLSRLSRGTMSREDVVQDLLGYLILLRVAEKADEGKGQPWIGGAADTPPEAVTEEGKAQPATACPWCTLLGPDCPQHRSNHARIAELEAERDALEARARKAENTLRALQEKTGTVPTGECSSCRSPIALGSLYTESKTEKKFCRRCTPIIT